MFYTTRCIICLFFIVCSSLPARAQSNYYEEVPKVFEGGLVLGGNSAQVDGDTYYGFHKIGLHAGGQVYIHFTPKLGVTMDLLYSQKGSKGNAVSQSQVVGTYIASYYMKLNYAEVPVTFHYREHGFDLEAGVAYARLINFSEGILEDKPVAIDPVNNAFGTSDLLYVVGMTVKAYKKIHVNLRYQYSILSIRPDERIPVNFGYGNKGQFNNLFNVRVIYLF